MKQFINMSWSISSKASFVEFPQFQKFQFQNLTTVIFWYDLQEVDREVIDSIRSVQREYIDKRGVEHNFTEVSSTKHFTTHPQVTVLEFFLTI